jgi:hypothetical protein
MVALLLAPIQASAKKNVDFLPSVCNDIRHHALAFGKRKLKSRLNPHFLD